MKHFALLLLAACATTPADKPARVYDFGPRTLAQIAAVPPHSSSPKTQVVAMLAGVHDAIAACHLTGTFQTDFTIEDGAIGGVVVTPDAPCLRDAIAGADASIITGNDALSVTLPLVLEPGYAAAP